MEHIAALLSDLLVLPVLFSLGAVLLVELFKGVAQ